MILRIGTRASSLARAQTAWVVERLRAERGDLDVEVVLVRTEGDRLQSSSPAGGATLEKGLFTRALDEALLSGAVDLTVHSLKDVPTERPEGVVLAAVPKREDARDVLCTDGPSLADLPVGARLGTSSPRRSAFLRALRRDLTVVPMRGNVDTRLRKLDAGEVDALVLAAAGLARLGLGHRIREHLDPAAVPPAPGQGALAVEGREGDAALESARLLDDPATRSAVEVERAVLDGLGGGCSLPLGVFARLRDGALDVIAALEAGDGEIVRVRETCSPEADPAAAGRRIADRLLGRGR